VSSRSLARFLLQAALIVAAAAAAAIAHLSAVAIIGVVAGAFGLVALSEWLAGGARGRRRESAPVGPLPERRRVAVQPEVERRRPAAAVDWAAWEPVRDRRVGARPLPAAEVAPAAAASPIRPAPIPVPATVGEPPTRVELAPERVDEAPPEAAPPPPPPAPAAPVIERRRWNVFELEQRARRAAGANPERDEERNFLLLYLREFGDVSGDLPEHFDPFVRESFPELL
jgi:hypothetical protein